MTNDDCGFGVLTSCFNLAVVSGKTYMIQVDGYGGNSGSVNLYVIDQTPSNDAFARCVVTPYSTVGRALVVVVMVR